MKNTQKDRRDKKLLRFLKELDGHNFLISDIDGYEKWRHEIYKKYGFTEDDWHKAVRLVMSISNKDQYWDGVGYKKDVLNRKEKCAKKLERNLHSGKQEHLDKVGEEELENERRWILDVYDEDYDPEKDMQR